MLVRFKMRAEDPTLLFLSGALFGAGALAVLILVGNFLSSPASSLEALEVPAHYQEY